MAAWGLLAAYTIEIVHAGGGRLGAVVSVQGSTTGFAGIDGTAATEFAVLNDNLGMLFWTLVGLGIRADYLSGVKRRH